MIGKFITFEGCEGVGKTTQVDLLWEYLQTTNQKSVFTREPGGTLIAERIREILLDSTLQIAPETEAYLFATARVDHIINVILPNLKKGNIVVCDRYVDSSIAYQGVARKLGIDYIENLNIFALEKALPDCTVFIDMHPKDSWRKQKGEKIIDDRLENEDNIFHEKCYLGFKILAEKYSNRFVSIVPENNPLATFEKIKVELQKRGLIK